MSQNIKNLIVHKKFFFRPESENSSESSSQLMSPTGSSGSKPSLFPGLPSPANNSDDKDSSKNNILLAMLWLQRHREIMNMSSQQNESKVRKFVTFHPFGIYSSS